MCLIINQFALGKVVIYLWLMLCKLIRKIMIRNMNAIRMKTQNEKLGAANNDAVLIVNRSSSGGLTGILHEKSM
jgi:hypothetical protein